jgi:hypothetical protein
MTEILYTHRRRQNIFPGGGQKIGLQTYISAI